MANWKVLNTTACSTASYYEDVAVSTQLFPLSGMPSKAVVDVIELFYGQAKTRCQWCGASTFDDSRGNCSACGGSR